MKRSGLIALVALVIISGCLTLSVCLKNVVAEQEEAEAGDFTLGNLNFTYFPAKDQPLPKIINGVAQYEFVNKRIEGFYLADRVVVETDFSEYFQSIGLFQNRGRRIPLVSMETSLFLRYLNNEIAPDLAKQGIEGSFVLPTWADTVRALFDGAEPKTLLPGKQLRKCLFATRYSEEANWNGENLGSIAIGSKTIRREQFAASNRQKTMAWAFPDEIESYIKKRERNSDKILGYRYGPVDVTRSRHLITLKFQLSKKEVGERE